MFFLYILGVEVQKSQMNVENKQAHTLFGVIGLFFFGHLFRIVLNINDIYLLSFREVNKATNCDCVVDLPLYTFVSICIINIIILYLYYKLLLMGNTIL